MARRTANIKPFSVAGIERGLARGEAREQRAENLAREDARIEQERLDRQVQQGFQAVGAQQRQQGIDIQQQQLEASIQQRQAEFDAQQQEIVDAREERQSQANISNSISIADAMLKAPGIDDNTKRKILKTIAGEMDDVFAGVDLNAVDSSKVLGDLIPLWKEFEKGKLTTEQLFISTSLIAAQNKESQEATQLTGTAGALLTQEGLKERSEIAAGGGVDKNTTQFRGFIKDISARLSEVDLDDRPVLPLGSERRRRQEERLDFYQAKVDESFGFVPRETATPPTAPVAPVPSPPLNAPPFAAPIAQPKIPPWLEKRGKSVKQKGAGQKVKELQKEQEIRFLEESRYYITYVQANGGIEPTEEEFDDAFAEAKRRQVEKVKAGGVARLGTEPQLKEPTEEDIRRIAEERGTR